MSKVNIFKGILSQYHKGYDRLMVKSIDEYYKGPNQFWIDFKHYVECNRKYPTLTYTDINLAYHKGILCVQKKI